MTALRISVSSCQSWRLLFRRRWPASRSRSCTVRLLTPSRVAISSGGGRPSRSGRTRPATGGRGRRPRPGPRAAPPGRRRSVHAGPASRSSRPMRPSAAPLDLAALVQHRPVEVGPVVLHRRPRRRGERAEHRGRHQSGASSGPDHTGREAGRARRRTCRRPRRPPR